MLGSPHVEKNRGHICSNGPNSYSCRSMKIISWALLLQQICKKLKAENQAWPLPLIHSDVPKYLCCRAPRTTIIGYKIVIGNMSEIWLEYVKLFCRNWIANKWVWFLPLPVPCCPADEIWARQLVDPALAWNLGGERGDRTQVYIVGMYYAQGVSKKGGIRKLDLK